MTYDVKSYFDSEINLKLAQSLLLVMVDLLQGIFMLNPALKRNVTELTLKKPYKQISLSILKEMALEQLGDQSIPI